MKMQDMYGAGLVVVGIALLGSNKFVGMLFVGFGLGFNVRPLIEKAFFQKKKKKK